MTKEFLNQGKGKVIGVDGDLPWHYREDLKRFKRRTLGCAVIMGRVTWDSIRHKELPGRRNIVISRSRVPEVECYDSIEKAIEACQNRDLWVIGGAQIYQKAMTHLNLLDVTLVPNTCSRNDATEFPQFDLSKWQPSRKIKLPLADSKGHLECRVYRRKNRADVRNWYKGKKIFDSYRQKEKTSIVKEALDTAGISYHETRKGKWCLGLAGLWVNDTGNYDKASVIIKDLREEWEKNLNHKLLDKHTSIY